MEEGKRKKDVTVKKERRASHQGLEASVLLWSKQVRRNM
jgi:hypothetical protein